MMTTGGGRMGQLIKSSQRASLSRMEVGGISFRVTHLDMGTKNL